MKTLTLALVSFASFCAPALLAETPAKLEFPAASPSSVVKQRVGITDVEITYSRPSVKGRTIFGGLVPHGQTWRTGANQATQISFSTPVKAEGKDLPAGTYELFTIPGESEWTVIFHKPMSQWGTYTYKEENDVLRVAVSPVKLAQPVESLEIGFDALRDDGATLQIAWDKTLVPVKIQTDALTALPAKIEEVMKSDAAKKPYAQAAMFYAAHNLDLKKAVAWMDAAIQEQPDAFYYVYQKARILAQAGDKAGALAAAQQSLAAAEKARGPLRTEYVRLNQELIASLK